MKKISLVILAAVLAAVVSSCAIGDKGSTGPTGAGGGNFIAVQEGMFPSAAYAGTSDARVRSDDPTTNFGSSTGLQLGVTDAGDLKRGLFKFDLTSITLPAGAAVTKAQLLIYCVDVYSNTPTFTMHAVTANWDEAQVTWNDRVSATPWTITGGTYSATAEGPAVGMGVAGKFYTFEISQATIQSWINTPATNYGVIMKLADESVLDKELYIYTSETGTASLRPMLKVYYTLP